MFNTKFSSLTQIFREKNNPFSLLSSRFRACLRKSKTGASNMVGTVFFDVVKTRCFVFKMEKTCKKWSWWGRCEKYGMEKVASLRDPIPWSS